MTRVTSSRRRRRCGTRRTLPTGSQRRACFAATCWARGASFQSRATPRWVAWWAGCTRGARLLVAVVVSVRFEVHVKAVVGTWSAQAEVLRACSIQSQTLNFCFYFCGVDYFGLLGPLVHLCWGYSEAIIPDHPHPACARCGCLPCSRTTPWCSPT